MSFQIHIPTSTIGRLFPLLIVLQMYVVFVEPFYHGTRFEELRQLLGPKFLYGSVYFLVIVHSLEAFLALRACFAKKFNWATTLGWFVSVFIYGAPTLMILKSTSGKSKNHVQ
ncbi:TMEM254-like protein [Schizosaccharomyces osmophilus]|uniref:TMEM254-like protein n=1 Tax=Schizosaccharomyces osmophilus TaxID=2545709 RepID=A0AAF0AW56_9SCHI|nr:TMEM254-like protein [Schizosaccharomyces osmophilus]WBW72604.1 TMEM254-like protein [Schizosaccharomyces osmophilus]